jgi:hypothetical protein
MTVHLIKLCVGVTHVIELFQEYERLARARRTRAGRLEDKHRTRSRPQRADEVLDGGSLFWVVKGVVRARNRILRLDDVQDREANKFCEIVYDPRPILVAPRPRRAFQGWRYLEPADAPPDLPDQKRGLREAKAEPNLSAEMARDLRALGLI